MDVIRLALKSAIGCPYTGRFTGTLIAGDEHHCLYRKADGQVLVLDTDRRTYRIVEVNDALEDLRDVVQWETYLRAMQSLRIKVTVDL